jgi:pimeloyl-ACP methyl ester carboxylesterase
MASWMGTAVKKQVLLAALAGGSAVAGQRLARRYRLDREAAYARLAAVGRTAVVTRFGEVEYAERGSGEPLLAIHGFYGGCDSALLSLRGLAADRQVIAPSRFGYLGSSMPAGASVAGQADAFAALLDGLGIDRLDVIAISSGATSTFQLALRHPDRVKHLAVISGNLPGGAAAVAPPQAARFIYRDVPLWALNVFARPVLLRQIGVPNGCPNGKALCRCRCPSASGSEPFRRGRLALVRHGHRRVQPG